jgi:histone H3/H4
VAQSSSKGGTRSAPFAEKPVPPPTQRIIKGGWTYRGENPKEQSESALKALKERAQALKELSQEIKRHSELFVRDGPRMLTPSETNARRQQIEELATKIEKLADSGPRQNVTYRDVEKILEELRELGFFPDSLLVANAARALISANKA